MKLYYFDMIGRAEPIRLLLTHAGLKFEDIRIPFPEWPKYKSKFELGQIPVLEIDGKQYCQTTAILEFLGAKYKYIPKNFGQLSKVIFVINTLEDFYEKAYAIVSKMSPLDEKTKAEMLPKVTKEFGPLYLGAIEKLLKENPCKEYIIGKKYTIADFFLLGLYRSLIKDEDFHKHFYDYFTKTHPELNEYLKKRMKDFACYYGEGKLKLYYFDMAGRAEMIRMLLKYVKAPFEDIRIKFDDWGKEKTSGKFPLQQVPVLTCEATGMTLCQTDAIMHWLGKKYDLVPKKAEKFYKVLWWCNTTKDILEGCMRIYLPIPEDKKKEILKTFYENSVPVFLHGMEERLKENKTQEFLVGRKNTIADFYLLGVYRGVIMGGQFNEVKDQLSEYPTLLKYLELKDKQF